MSKPNSELEYLARRAKRGDPEATQAFQQALQGAMVPIVRLTLQTGRCFHSLGRHILAEARYLAPNADPTETWERLYRPVTNRLCERILSRVSPRVRTPELLLDTIRN